MSQGSVCGSEQDMRPKECSSCRATCTIQLAVDSLVSNMEFFHTIKICSVESEKVK